MLKGISIGSGSSAPPDIEIAVGALAIVVFVLVGTGVGGVTARQSPVATRESPPPGHEDKVSQGPHGIEQIPGFENCRNGPRLP